MSYLPHVSAAATDSHGRGIAFNLINDIDVAATEAKIAEHRAANAALIEANEQREAREAANLRDIEERERLDRQQRAEDARRTEEEAERERERSRLELINQLVRPHPIHTIAWFGALI